MVERKYPLFLEKNCCAVSTASHISMLVDCANYYRALYQSIKKAKHSIFVLGWDIDSRIELIRDEHNPDKAVTFFDLICEQARKNPEMQIYLNKWNYSSFFISQREPFWVRRWKNTDLPNIHVCLDGRVPLGACHHQKVVLIDDEIVFWGGMDVALGRWDSRQHALHEPCREDPSGLPMPKKLHEFGPYHDIQAVAAGPVVSKFAEIVRDRWHAACDIDTVPPRPSDDTVIPDSWPQGFPPKFKDVKVVLARTVPAMQGRPAIQEVESLFLTQISQAENFIYIENQYFTNERIAWALNKQLRDNPRLRVMLVSCDIPQGFMEHKVMWCGRVICTDILKSGGVEDRVLIVYPETKERPDQDHRDDSVHIHSKLMVVDDKFLRLGSSNICDRSMGMDTELDVSIISTDAQTSRAIEAVRNDLIREHCGRELDDIQNIISSGGNVAIFAEEWPTSHQHFRVIDDEKYRNEKFVQMLRFFGDPKKPIVPILGRIKYHSGLMQGGEPRSWFFVPFAIAIVTALLLLWYVTPLSDYVSVKGMTDFLRNISDSPWAMLQAILLYVVAGTCFVPITAMTVAAVVVFGPIKGMVISFTGAVLCGVLGHALGRIIGADRLSSRFGKVVQAIFKKIRNSGIAGVTALRIIPTGPYMFVNMVLGAAGVSLLNFTIGTIMGLLPGKVAIALTGDGLLKVFKDPHPQNIAYLIGGLALWVGVIVLSQKLSKKWQGKKGQEPEGEARHAT